MKTIYLLTTAILFILTGCFSDTDKVDYNAYNVLTLSDDKAGEEREKLIRVDRFFTLKLTPTIAQSQEGNESNLEFNWRIRENTVALNPYPYRNIGSTRNLEFEVDVAVGIHRIIYSVTDKITGVTKFLYYNIEVIGEYTKGWTILEEVSGGGDISMILPTGRIVRNIYSRENGVFLETPCVSLSISNHANMKKIFVLTATQGVECSREEYTKLTEFADWFVPGTAPTPAETRPKLYVFTVYLYGGLVNNGNYHARVGGGFPGDPAFGGAIPAPVETDGFRKEYNIAPFIVGRTDGSTATSRPMQIIYDNLQQRFLYLILEGLTPCLKYFPYDAATDPWNPGNTGMSLAYMGNSNVVSMHNALMYDSVGDLFVVKFSSDAVYLATTRFTQSIAGAPSILKGFSTAVNSKVLDHMYVAVGNKIHHYDIPGSSSVEAYAFGANENIIRMHTVNNSGAETLYVATYDGSQGRVYYFPLEPSGSITNNTYSEKFEGFGKIVDLQYKE